MVSVAKPWLICGYNGLSKVIVIMFFSVLFVVKPCMVNFRKGNHVTTCPNLTSMKNTQCKRLLYLVLLVDLPE